MIQITSVNIAKPRNLIHKGNTYPTGIFKEPVDGAVAVNVQGFADDVIMDKSVHGGVDQALYLYSTEDYQWWGEQVEKAVKPGVFGENLTVSGIDLSLLKVGDRFSFGSLLLEVTGPRIPCIKLALRMDDTAFLKKFVAAARPGVYVRVLAEGMIQSGQLGEYIPTEADFVECNALYAQWHQRDKDHAVLKKALDSPLSKHHVATINGWSVRL